MRGLLITNLCLGVFRPFSPIYCYKPHHVANNIVGVSHYFDYCFIVNDEHRHNDKEMETMPPHNMVGSVDTFRMRKIEGGIKSKYLQVLKKNSFNAINNQHNLLTITNSCDDIFLAGFCLSMDVVETAKALVEKNIKVSIIQDCVGDITTDMLTAAIKELHSIGVKIVSKDQLK